MNSGLVVNTTATWDPLSQEFVIHSPNEGAWKNWISQGLTAERAVVIADLRVGEQRLGPHGFLIDMVDPATSRPHPGIVTSDMGRKTTGLDLDNACVRFDHLRVPKGALLNRFGNILGDQYVPAAKGIRTMDMIGQRLFTGRVAVAQAALTFARKLFASTRTYSDAKLCAMRVGTHSHTSKHISLSQKEQDRQRAAVSPATAAARAWPSSLLWILAHRVPRVPPRVYVV